MHPRDGGERGSPRPSCPWSRCTAGRVRRATARPAGPLWTLLEIGRCPKRSLDFQEDGSAPSGLGHGGAAGPLRPRCSRGTLLRIWPALQRGGRCGRRERLALVRDGPGPRGRERPRRSSRGAPADTAESRSSGQEPADAVLNTAAWQGGRCAPLRPPAFRAAERSADGRGRPRPEPRRRCARA